MTLKYDKNTKLIGGFSIDIVDETDPVWSYMLRHNMLDENIDWVTEDVITDLLEKPKVKLPKFVADRLEEFKEAKGSLGGALVVRIYPNEADKEVVKWLSNPKNQELFARAWLDGYDIEKGKLYTAKLKLTDMYLAYDNDNVEYYFTDEEMASKFTEEEFKKMKFWDNPAFEVEEVHSER